MMALAESIERLDSMPEFVEAAVEIVSPQHLVFRPAPGRFSLVEHACHLRDLEREGYLVRARRMISESLPTLESFDGGAVARARDYQRQDARAAAREFATARQELVALLEPLTTEQLAREALFGDERITFAGLVAMIVEHDGEHRAEIEDLMDAIERQ